MDGSITDVALGVVPGLGPRPHAPSGAWGADNAFAGPARGRSGRGADVTVWEADGLLDGASGYAVHIASRLAGAGLAVSVVPLTERHPDDAELAASVHVLTGGTTAVSSRVAWLESARRSLREVLDEALAGRASVTGICFGAQLIAHVLAGPRAVERHPFGMQAGMVDAVDLADGRIVPVASFHYHHIVAAPLADAGARILLASEATPVQAFEFGRGVSGVQSHPELGPDELAGTLVANRDVLERYGANVPEAVVSIEAARDRWTDELWQRFVLEPADRFVPPEPTGVTAA